MAVALDAATESHTGTTASSNEASFNWSHVPVGTPRGVVVFVSRYGPIGASASAVTYGSASLSEVTEGSASDTAGEPMRMQTFFLGASIPAGTQTVTVTRTNNADSMYAVCGTVTAAGDTEIYLDGIVLLQEDGTLAEQSVDDGRTSGTSLRFAAVQSGEDTGTNIAAGSNSTQVQAFVPGNRVVKVFTEATGGSGSRPVGAVWGTTDDRAAVHLAIREVDEDAGAVPAFARYRVVRR